MWPISRDQGGFTVLEVLVAVLLLSVGVLALGGGAALATRMIGDARRHTQAIAVGRGVAERLRGGPCPREGSGGLSRNPYEARWTVSPAAGGMARRVVVVVETPRVGRAGADTVLAIIPC